MRQKLEDDRLKVESIKQKKLGMIQDLGIDSKYQYELAKKKIVWIVLNWRNISNVVWNTTYKHETIISPVSSAL